MSKFIRLTEVGKQHKGERPVIMNTAYIQSIKKSDSGPDTHIHLGGSTYFYVKETLTEVEAMLALNARPMRDLAQGAPEPGPVAWQFQRLDGVWTDCGMPDDFDLGKSPDRFRPLYAGSPLSSTERK